MIQLHSPVQSEASWGTVLNPSASGDAIIFMEQTKHKQERFLVADITTFFSASPAFVEISMKEDSNKTYKVKKGKGVTSPFSIFLTWLGQEEGLAFSLCTNLDCPNPCNNKI